MSCEINQLYSNTIRFLAADASTDCGCSRLLYRSRGLVITAFNQIRQYARSSTAVTIRLLDMIAVISGVMHRQEVRIALLRHLNMIAWGVRDGLQEIDDRRAVEKRYQEASRALREPDLQNHAVLEPPDAE